jgi:GT2 family glycosyltransferase
VIHNPRRAISAGRELGWRAARAPLVAFLDADCTAPPHWLARLVAAQERLAADAVGGGNRPPIGESRFYDALAIAIDSYVGAYHSVQGRRFATARPVEHLPGLNVLYRRAALDAVGGYDPRFAFMGEDADLSWKLRKKGMRLYYVPDAEVIHRQRPGFVPWLRRMFRYGEGRAALLRKHTVADRRPPGLYHVAPLLIPLMPGLHVPFVTLYGLYRGLRAGRPGLGLHVALVLWLTHLGYGAGEWVGLFSSRLRTSKAPQLPG